MDFHHVLLLGYGIIGRSIASCMKTHHVQMSVCDTDDEVLQSAKADGLKLWNGDFFADMLVLGNVGKPSFTKAMLDRFLHSPARRIYLASASSKQVEFEETI